MAFTADSPLVNRVVPTASSEQGARRNGAADIKAICIHMAEGGGTVSWLARPDGNSSHYVIEYSGTIVQMVPERNWAGSINPKQLRRDNDPAYTYQGESIVYGRAAQLQALGAIAAADPNRYVIAFEVEGFANVGPNTAQRGSIRALVNDIRRRRGALPALGHRDFQNYKACPGHRISWADLGGHAKTVGYQPPTPQPEPPPAEEPMGPFATPEVPTNAVLKLDPSRPGESMWLYSTSELKPDGKETSLNPNRPLRVVVVDPAFYGLAYEPAAPDPNSTSLVMYTPVSSVASTSPVVVTEDCAPKIAAAIAADRARATIVYT